MRVVVYCSTFTISMKNQNLFHKIVIAALIAVIASPAFSQNLPAPKRESLLNGLKVLMWPDAKADKVSVKIRIHAGSAFDPQGKEGVMQLLADNIFPNEGAREFFSENLGGSLDIVTNYDYIQVNASSKPEGFVSMLETLSTAISNPAIDKETTIKLRTALLAKVAALETDPAYVADRAVAKRLFGTFPYGRPQLGSPASLAKINFADLIDAKARFLTADNATIAVSGNFDSSLGYKAIRRGFGGWLKSDKKVPSTFRQPDAPLAELLSIKFPGADKGLMRLALRGLARSDKDLVTSLIFTAIMENRLKARVPASMISDAFVRNEPHSLPGLIVVGFSVSQNDTGNGNEKVIGFANIDPFTEAEFETAKNSIKADWSKKETASLWLDADTYKLADAATYAHAADNITIASVNAYAEKIRKSPVASVLVNNPQKAN